MNCLPPEDWRIVGNALLGFAVCLMVWIPYWLLVRRSNKIRAKQARQE